MAVMAIFFIGVLLRFAFLDFGLPGLYLEDEVFFVSPVITMDRFQTMDPAWYGTPGHTVIYSTYVMFRLVNAISQIGEVAQPLHLRYEEAITMFQVAGRVIPAAAGSLSVLLAYAIGRHWSSRVGVISAVLFATSFYFVEHSHIIRPDITQTFFLLVAMLFVFRAMDRPERLSSYAGIGMFWGLAITTKYPSLFFFVPLLFVLLHFAWNKRISWKHPLTGLIGLIFSLGISGPYIFTHWSAVLESLRFENRTSHSLQGGFGFFGNVKWYVFDSLSWEVGTVIYVLAIGVLGILLIRAWKQQALQREKKWLILGVAAISYVLCLSFLSLHWERWLIPVMAFTFFLSAVGIDFVLSIFRGNKTLSMLFIILIFAGPGMRLARTMYGFANPHTIAQATEWANAHIPAGSIVVAEPYTLDDLESEHVVVFAVPNIGWYPVREYQKREATYFVISGSIYESIQTLANQTGDKDQERAVRLYRQSIQTSTIEYEVFPHPVYTVAELIKDDDFSVWRTTDIKLFRGEYIKIYQFTFPLVQ